MSEILIIIGLILLNGVFSMSEVAMISARKSRLSTDAKEGEQRRHRKLWTCLVIPTDFCLPYRLIIR